MPDAPTTTPPPDQSQQFNSEWDQAQARYRAGVNAGYDPADADQMYLAPVRDKWDILKDVPATMRPQASKELDDAHLGFLKGIQSGYKAADAENIYLKPAQQKWVASSEIPQKKQMTEAELRAYYEQSPALKAEESDALQQIASGVPEKQAIEGHPALLTTPGYNTRWSARYLESAKAENTASKTAEKAATPEVVIPKLMSLYRAGSSPLATNLPPAVVSSMKQEIGNLQNQLTKAPARVTFPPPPSTGTAAEPAPDQSLPSGPATGTSKYKTKFTTAAAVGEAYRSKELTRDEAKRILQDQFGIQ